MHGCLEYPVFEAAVSDIRRHPRLCSFQELRSGVLISFFPTPRGSDRRPPHPPQTLRSLVLGKFRKFPTPSFPLFPSAFLPRPSVPLLSPSEPCHFDVSIVAHPSITEFAGQAQQKSRGSGRQWQLRHRPTATAERARPTAGGVAESGHHRCCHCLPTTS